MNLYIKQYNKIIEWRTLYFIRSFFCPRIFTKKILKGIGVFGIKGSLFLEGKLYQKIFFIKGVLKKLNAKNYKKFLNANQTPLYTGRTYPYVRKITQEVLCAHFQPSSPCIPSPLIQHLHNK